MIWPPLLIRLALTASGTARFLSILLLILSVAPWASIYALMVSMHGTHTFMKLPQHDEPTLANVLQNHTLEDLWMALFRDRAFSVVYKEDFLHQEHVNTIHHWTIVLPWGISLALGIVIPFLLSLCSCMYGRDEFYVDPDEDPWISRHCKERRLSRLICACEDYRKVRHAIMWGSTLENCFLMISLPISSQILSKDDVHSTITTDNEEQVSKWKLPLPGTTVCTFATTRTVEGTCAVCLGHYAVGDEVIWSSNPKCQHVFHDDCILSWLLRRRKQCPCCRQSFLVKAE